jgi:nicotinamide-nucleotide amidase
MMEEQILPLLRRRLGHGASMEKNFHLFGVPESRVDEWIRPFVSHYKKRRGCRITHTILASQWIITVRFRVDGPNSSAVAEASDFLSKKIRKKLGSRVFGEDHQTMEGAVGALLKKKGLSLAVAESCTGGLIAKMITDQPGSSDYFKEGVVCYSNESKINRLGVKSSTLARVGAVSKEVARAMAEGIKKGAKADIGVSITGIAGPGGGTPNGGTPGGGTAEKPVGLVFLGLSTPRKTVVQELRLSGERALIRHRAALSALEMIRKELLK